MYNNKENNKENNNEIIYLWGRKTSQITTGGNMVRWGIIGLGNISHRFIKSLENFENAEFYAGSSRTIAKREEILSKYNPKKIYDEYEELLNDENVDAVYIALPHKQHFEWALKAMQAGKAVFVEKPCVLTTSELKVLIEYSEKHNILFMEAMKTRFLPITTKIHEVINSNKIGDITKITNYFTYNLEYDPNIYLFDATQGGALYDTGTYNIASILDYINDEVININVDAHINYNVDTYIKSEIDFKNGQKAIMINSIEDESNRSMVIEGTIGKVTFVLVKQNGNASV